MTKSLEAMCSVDMAKAYDRMEWEREKNKCILFLERNPSQASNQQSGKTESSLFSKRRVTPFKSPYSTMT
ncbi:hypothetical protein ACJIZ3_000066 [Penstemon smallii]|uniref:Uncharacterized protein n=1 Tax=Penstemon smallii TaxID=265156 RepID=A0ABD3RGL4_9LAMI